MRKVPSNSSNETCVIGEIANFSPKNHQYSNGYQIHNLEDKTLKLF